MVMLGGLIGLTPSYLFLLFVAMHSVGIIGSAGSGFIANERNCILKRNIIVLLSNLIFT